MGEGDGGGEPNWTKSEFIGFDNFLGPRSYLSDVSHSNVSLITATVISDVPSWDEGNDNLSLVMCFFS